MCTETYCSILLLSLKLYVAYRAIATDDSSIMSASDLTKMALTVKSELQCLCA